MVDTLIRYFTLGTLVLAISCSRQSNPDTGNNVAVPIVKVKVDTLTLGRVDDRISTLGRTAVLRKETLSSPVAGKVLSMNVQEGSPVQSGQVVAILRTREAEAIIQGAEALSRNASTPMQKEEALRALKVSRETQSTVILRAGITGVVAGRPLQEGELVNEKDSLLTILDLNALVFQADIALSGLGKVSRGLKALVTLQALPDRSFQAEVTAISPRANGLNQTVPVTLGLTDVSAKERALLKSEMPGEARILVGGRDSVLLAPKIALLRNDETGISSLVHIESDSLARIVEIRTGAEMGDRMEISGLGLYSGANVVTEGQYSLSDSTKVDISR